MPDVQLITDADATANQGQDMVEAGVDPNPYEGMLSTVGATGTERWANKNVAPAVRRHLRRGHRNHGPRPRPGGDEQPGQEGPAVDRGDRLLR